MVTKSLKTVNVSWKHEIKLCRDTCGGIFFGNNIGTKHCQHIVCTQFLEGIEVDYKKAKSGAGSDFDGPGEIEKLIGQHCAKQKKSGTAEFKKICYFLEPIKRQVSVPMSNFKPADRVCRQLKKSSPEICQVRPQVVVEKGKTDYNELRVKDLKKILAERGVACAGCTDKAEFVKKCQESEGHEEL